ncbi:MYXO-CTERM domain-containing protein [Sulfurivirga caldicuralii]|uniref:MYXO-CTERM domain-containing protein n=1 Tax=Sulfurivirga caldicuralii TaxID=364032 RepID=A0A1N6HDK7_9GAMM|nr:hypothetical protein [Sulfurivirga caldicuralii]SIO17918.1 MYXO-CTERM domain-containing protein [Sulfurivirga caldicuralii]
MDEALRGLSDIVLVPPSWPAVHEAALWPWLVGLALLIGVLLWQRRRLMLLWLRARLRAENAQPCACRLYAWLQGWHTPLTRDQRVQLEQLCFGGDGDADTLKVLLRELKP